MSKSIDQRIAEMRFDNGQFESGVKTSISSLDKLKKALNLQDSAKGLSDLQKVGRTFSLEGIASGVDTIARKFSNLGIIGVTALQNITNSAIRAGEQLLKSLTIDPISTGFQEYETQINAVQTILANTQGGQKKVSQEAINAIKDTANVATMETAMANRESLENLKDTQEQKLREYKRLADEELEVLEDKYDRESEALEKAINDEADKLENAHREKLSLYEEEYMQRLKSVDEERYNAIKAIDKQIKAINDLTKAEEAEIERTEQKNRILELQNRIGKAKTIDDRLAAEKDLADYQAKIKRKELLASRDQMIDELNNRKDSFNQEFDELEKKIKKEYDLQKEQENELYKVASKNLKEQQKERTKILKENYETEKEYIKDRQAAEQQMLKENQLIELETMKKTQESALKNIEEKKNAEIKALTEVSKATTKGSTLEDVNKALDELNDYADKTIYNFTEMTRNIGTFTAAGVDLDTSVSAIKGIANLAAVSGSSSQEASSAMYQLSQALASGTVKLMDWNSVINAKMGGQLFQEALKDTARVHGIAIDQLIADQGSFRDSLSEGWLSSEILTETLSKFTGDLTKEQIKAMGYTDEQVEAIYKMGETAKDAATKVKTFTQLFDTLREAAQSGWAQSWRIIIGDFEEAKTLLTELSDKFGAIIGNSANARNEMLQFWKDAGGRQDLVDSLRNVFEAFESIVKPIKEAFQEIFPPMTGEKLASLTKGLEAFTEKLKIGDDAAKNIKKVFSGLFSVIDLGLDTIGFLVDIFVALVKAIAPASGGLLDLVGKFGNYLTAIRNAAQDTDFFNTAFQKVSNVITTVVDTIKEKLTAFMTFVTPLIPKIKEAFASIGTFITNTVSEVKTAFEKFEEFIAPAIQKIKDAFANMKKTFSSFEGFDLSGLSSFGENVKTALEPVSKVGDFINKVFTKLKETFSGVMEFFKKVGSFLGKIFGPIFEKVSSGIENLSFDQIMDIAKTGLFGAFIIGIKNFIKSLTSATKSAKKILDSVKGILDGVQDTLETFQARIKADIITKIAIAIAILAASLIAISFIDQTKLLGVLGAITVLFADLFGSMAIFGKISGKDGFGGLGKLATTMISVAAAVLILSFAMMQLAKLDTEKMAQGIVVLTIILAEVMASIAILSKASGTIKNSADGLIAFAVSLAILAGVVYIFGTMNMDAMAQGIVGMGIVIAELVVLMIAAGIAEGKGRKGVSALGKLIGFSIALTILAGAVAILGNMKDDTLLKGLAAMGIMMIEIAGLMVTLGIIGDKIKDSWSTLLSLIGFAMAFTILSGSVAILGNMKDDALLKGLAAMGIMLIEIEGLMVILGMLGDKIKNSWTTLLSLVGFAAAIQMLALAVLAIGQLKIDQAAIGVGAVAVLLMALAGAAKLASGSTSAILALTGLVAALYLLIPAFILLAQLKIGQVGIALLAIAGIFVILGVAGAVLGPLAPVITALAISIAVLGGAFLAAGLGMTLFAGGLALLIATIVKNADNVPTIFKAMGDAVVGFFQSIADSAPKLAAAFTQIIMAFLNERKVLIPEIVKATLELLTTLVQTLIEYVPNLVDSGMKLLNGILDGIENNIKDVTSSAVGICVGFINGVAEQMPAIIQAGINWTIGFINGLADGMRNNYDRVKEAVINLFKAIGEIMVKILEDVVKVVLAVGKKIMDSGLIQGIKDKINDFVTTIKELPTKAMDAIKEKIANFIKIGAELVDGLIKGIKGKVDEIVQGARDLGKNMVDGISDFLGIKSPSKVFEEIGMYADQGLINGLEKYSGKVGLASEGVGDTAITSLKDVLSNISDSIDNDFDMRPTIRPVVDMTDVESGLNSTFGKHQGINVSASINKVSDIAAQRQNGSSMSDAIRMTTTNNTPITINNTYHVRNDNDIKKISQDLNRTIERFRNARGVPVYDR